MQINDLHISLRPAIVIAMREINYKINGQQYYETFNAKCCYGWWRRGKYLYIGQTKVGLSRISKQHHIINKIVPVEPDDEFHFWYCMGEQDLSEMEREMIKEHTPMFNQSNRPGETPNPNNETRCQFCQNAFKPAKSWQIFCSVECREIANNRSRSRKHRTPVFNLVRCQCGTLYHYDIANGFDMCSMCREPKPVVEPPKPLEVLPLHELQRIWSKEK